MNPTEWCMMPTVEANDPVTAAVAANLRSLRAARGWSLDALARRSGVAKGTLVAVEQARSSPSIATLARIGDAFGISVMQLVAVDDVAPLRRVTDSDAVVLWRGASGGRGRLLLATDTTPATEVWSWTFAPGEVYEGEPHAAGTRETVVVHVGVARLACAGQQVLAAAGDAVALRGDREHSYGNGGDEPCELTLLVHLPVAATPWAAEGRLS